MSEKISKKIEFKVPKVDKKGNVIKNEAEDIVFDTYIYSFEEMGMDRKLMARKYFQLATKNLANPPKDPEHIEIIAERQLEIKGFSALLMKVIDGGKYELYEPTITHLSQYTMSELGKSEEDWNKLMEVQDDFFTKARLQSSELITQSNGIMMQSLGAMKEIQTLASQMGITGLSDMKEFTSMILEKAVSLNSEQSSKSE